MAVSRTKPQFGKIKSLASLPKLDNDSKGCCWMPFIIIIGYFILMSIARVITDDATRLDKIICLGTVLIFVVITIVAIVQQIPVWKARAAEKRAWIKACIVVPVSIVARREGGIWDDDFRYQSYPPSLDLQLSSDQKKVAPNEIIVTVNVDQITYNRLKRSSTVRIYYSPLDPFTFMLENEL